MGREEEDSGLRPCFLSRQGSPAPSDPSPPGGPGWELYPWEVQTLDSACLYLQVAPSPRSSDPNNNNVPPP